MSITMSVEALPEQRKPSATISMVGVKRDLEQRWRAAIDDLLQLRSFGEDWDGEGAPAPSPELVDSAIKLLQSAQFREWMRSPPDRIMPGPDGLVALEWFMDDAYLRARVDSPGVARCMYLKPGDPDEFFAWDWRPENREVVWRRDP